MIQVRDRRGRPVGAGFLVGDELALTCAHVVNAALGTPPGSEPASDALIDVTFPLLHAPAEGAQADGPDGVPQLRARVERWVPPQPSGAGDVAVLRLSSAVLGSRPLLLAEEPDVWQHPARVFGFPDGRPGGVWHSAVLRARQANGWVQADLAGGGYRVSRGFSGSPVWDEQLGAVVGMMALAEEGEPPASYLIPTAGLLDAWPGLRRLALPPSPFRSLEPFGESDAALFHGRRAESEAVARMVTAERWTAIVGPSGSGKSSLAQAGVVPRLRSQGCSVVVLRPSSGSSPAAGLAAELRELLEPGPSGTDAIDQLLKLTEVLRGERGLADVVLAQVMKSRGNERLLVVVDQFEELLARGPDDVDELARILFGADLPDAVRVLTTLRADFLGAALAHPGLGPAFDGRRVYALGPMLGAQLREVVTLPVDAVPGVQYEPRLVERILDDTGAGPGALPLLGFALDRLWKEQQRQTPGRLTYEAYDKIGGVAGALHDHLAGVWAARIPESDEDAARRLFSQLVRVPVESATVTRRVAVRTELGEDAWRVAGRLAADRLLVVGRDPEGTDTVELIHEALITGWDKLATWVTEDRTFLVWRETLRQDRRRWEEGERSDDLLPTTAALTAAEPWLDERANELTAAEREYLERGRLHHRTRARRRRALRSGLAVLVVLAVLFGSLFAYAREQSREREALANSRALTQFSQDQADFDPVLSVKVALAAYQASPTQEARSQLLRQYLEYAYSTRVLSGLLGTVEQFQTSRDGNVVFARSTLGRATLFVHALHGTVRSEQFGVKQVVYAMVSADGSRAAYVTHGGEAGWFEVHPDAHSVIGPVHHLPGVKNLMEYTFETRSGFAMSADGRLVVVRTGKDLMWWDLDRGTVGGKVRMPADMEGTLWFGSDNRTLLAQTYRYRQGHGGNSLVALDMATGKSRTVVSDADELTVSGDRSAVVVCRNSLDSAASYRLWRISGPAPQGRVYHAPDYGSCHTEGVDGTGRHVVIGDDSNMMLVDLVRGKLTGEATQLDGVDTTARDLVSSGGKLYLAGHSDSLINYLDLSSVPDSTVVNQQRLTEDGSRSINVAGGGARLQIRRMESSGDGKSPLIADIPRPRPYWLPEGNYHIVLNRKRDLLADWDSEKTVSVREVATLRRTAHITVPKPPSASDFQCFFDRHGRLVTVSGTVAQQWDPRTGRQLARFDIKPIVDGSTRASRPTTWRVGDYPADNQVSVLVYGDPTVHVVDLTTGRTTATVKVSTDTTGVQFDPSGRYVGILRSGTILELWRRDPWHRELGPLRSIAEDDRKPFVTSFLDGKGHFVLAANSSVRVYEIGTRAPVESYDFGRVPSSSVLGAGGYVFRDLTPDGKTVIFQNSDNRGGSLRLDPARWQRGLCEAIGDQGFTADERAGLPVRIPSQPVCP
ncbi:nSTAND1 domain-containing NTPase [Streptomyces cellostaticus]|uniref:nSTAND1 domain-containing NTPase n=1 Tax=Streptomyces cellostaticus TaxID=67285 RepID=UPI00131D55FE|nr:serine protease [Streptomyces cellostaticus]